MNRRLVSSLTTLAATVLPVLALSACGASSASPGEETKVIRYQSSSGGIIDLPEVADALGLLGDIELKRLGDVQGGPEALRAVATDQIDYGGAFNGAVAKLASTGAPVTSVISYYGSSGKVDSGVLTLEKAGVEGAEDLIGKKVAVNTLGANAEAVLDTWLRKEGLSDDQLDQVTLVPLPPLNMEQALRKGQVDAIYLFGAQKNIALSHGGIRTLVTDTDLVGEYNAGTYAMRDDFLARNPHTSEQFVGALAKALEYTQTQPIEKVRALMADYLREHGRAEQVPALDLWQGTGVSSPGGVIRDEDFSLWLDWLEAEGEVEPGSVDVEDIYTNEFNPYAEKGTS